MAKLFAFEELDDSNSNKVINVDTGELELIQDLPNLQEETIKISTHSESINDAIDTIDELNKVGSIVEKSIKEEGGLSPIAAEALQVAIESICARIGIFPKSLFAMYSVENYKGSSRLVSSEIALEGIGEFLRNLWERIKETLAISNRYFFFKNSFKYPSIGISLNFKSSLCSTS